MQGQRIRTKPRNSLTPYVLDVYDADKPVGSERVVARCDTRDGKVWRTNGATTKVSLREIHDAIRSEQR